MSKPDTWMPFYVADYLADTGHLSAEEHGAYLLLLMAAWLRGGNVPDDDVQLARLARCDRAQWKRMRGTVLAFFSLAAGQWTQKRLQSELEHARSVYSAAVENGKKGGRPRKPEGKPPGFDPVNREATQRGIPEKTQPQPQRQEAKDQSQHPMSDSPAKAPAASDVVPLPQSGKPSKLRAEASELLAFLNVKTGRHFRPTDATLKPLMARLKEGFSLLECRAVVVRKHREWQGGDMAKFLRPDTLFNATKFAQYIGEVPPDGEPVAEPRKVAL